ncbi:hypothetical protein [Polycladidibacter stylochi]|uniref:hypothetical protein n=1 Tax=Polycladidibacter stylochi TaxID=1807766 RepID=UPI00082FEB21|nr:hypothetical protein [Pseudovibrio stylochi]
MAPDKYQELLIDLYKENQSFLNKALFSVSTLAIPLLFKAILDYSENIKAQCMMALSLIGFVIVVTLMIISVRFAKEGCDKAIGGDTVCAKNNFDKARRTDKYAEIVFVISLFIILTAVVISVVMKGQNMSDKKLLNESFVPPKSIDKAFTPPVSLSNQAPAHESNTSKTNGTSPSPATESSTSGKPAKNK